VALRMLEGHSSYAFGVAVTPDGKRAVSASGDKTLKVWDLETGVALRTLEGHSSYFADPDKCTALLITVFRYVGSHLKQGRPLQLPDEVLEVYLANEYAAPRRECASLPFLPRRDLPSVNAVQYCQACQSASRRSNEGLMRATNEQIERAELNAVLSSTLFARAPDLSRILKYVCEKHFSNQSDTIKEYSIAVEALGRGPEFRPGEDSIVRVQAARLRKHLKNYYEADGANHRLQIAISATGYKPEFLLGPEQEAPATAAVDEQNLNGGTAGPSVDSFPPGETQDSSPGQSDAGTALERTEAPRSHPSPRLVLTLAAVALALTLIAVGSRFKYAFVASSAEPRPALPATPDALPEIKIAAGFTAPTLLDAAGATWMGDRYFTGGTAFSRADSQILRTFDQTLYQTGRRGNFNYAIPLQRGVYELHLHFAEVYFAPIVGADAQRTFAVSINGVLAMGGFDIAKDAGGTQIADERVFKDVSPGPDGLLRLDFSPDRGEALLNGIEVLPGSRGKMVPVRIRCSNRSYVDPDGRLWKADRYFSGGRIAERPDDIQSARYGRFSSYRTGNFNYAIPVPEGRYRIGLLFAEPVFGRELSRDNGAGRRVFDIYCNGRTLASGLDIFREAGGAYRVIEKTLQNVTPDAQGKILLSFVPVKNYSVLLAIEVVDQTP
jgi:hypothetical protein